VLQLLDELKLLLLKLENECCELGLEVLVLDVETEDPEMLDELLLISEEGSISIGSRGATYFNRLTHLGG
jgi:hypothetical protein